MLPASEPTATATARRWSGDGEDGAGTGGLTGRVCEFILLALYPVLERLRIATGDLDLLLDRFVRHRQRQEIRAMGRW
jgi:hypothetical protein